MEEDFVFFCANAYLDEVPTPLINSERCGNVATQLYMPQEGFGDYFGHYCDSCAEIVKQYVIDNSGTII